MKRIIVKVAASILTLAASTAPASANTGLLLQDLKDFSATAEYNQGSDGHVIIDCWRESWGSNAQAIIAQWRLRTYHSSLVYVNGAVSFSNSAVPRPLNGSPFGFSVPFSRVASGSEEIYLESADSSPVLATIGGYVEIGTERGAILPTTVSCPFR